MARGVELHGSRCIEWQRVGDSARADESGSRHVERRRVGGARVMARGAVGARSGGGSGAEQSRSTVSRQHRASRPSTSTRSRRPQLDLSF